MMQKIFEKKLSDVSSHIDAMDDNQLFSEKCEALLIERYKATTPVLDKSRMEYSIKKEVISTSNAPSGFSFVPGDEYDYVFYVIPFNQPALVSTLFNTGIKNTGLFINNNHVFYKEHSKNPLLGNTQELERIRDNAKAAIGQVETRLEQAKKQAEDFNEKVLPSHLSTKIHAEREKRKTLRNSLDTLKF